MIRLTRESCRWMSAAVLLLHLGACVSEAKQRDAQTLAALKDALRQPDNFNEVLVLIDEVAGIESIDQLSIWKELADDKSMPVYVRGAAAGQFILRTARPPLDLRAYSRKHGITHWFSDRYLGQPIGPGMSASDFPDYIVPNNPGFVDLWSTYPIDDPESPWPSWVSMRPLTRWRADRLKAMSAALTQYADLEMTWILAIHVNGQNGGTILANGLVYEYDNEYEQFIHLDANATAINK